MAVRRAVVGWARALVISAGLLALPLVAFAATSSVNIQNSAFAPATAPIRVGDTVTWTNRDAFSHTSTSDTGVWNSDVIRAGSSFSFTFRVAGTFAYHCAIHALMHGTIEVQAVTTPQPTAPPTAPPTPVRTAPPRRRRARRCRSRRDRALPRAPLLARPLERASARSPDDLRQLALMTVVARAGQTDDVAEILVTAEQIAAKVRELGARIATD